jgi:hypothetical protein
MLACGVPGRITTSLNCGFRASLTLSLLPSSRHGQPVTDSDSLASDWSTVKVYLLLPPPPPAVAFDEPLVAGGA